jgi:hypothetical protein
VLTTAACLVIPDHREARADAAEIRPGSRPRRSIQSSASGRSTRSPIARPSAGSCLTRIRFSCACGKRYAVQDSPASDPCGRGRMIRPFVVVGCGLLGGILGAYLGIFLGCVVFMRESNLCGLLGFFVTGPIGLICGLVAGVVYSRPKAP